MSRIAKIIVWSGLSLAAFGCGGGGSSPTSPGSSSSSSNNGSQSATVSWNYTGTAWAATGTAPACPSPFNSPLPVDLARVTSILYPGQTRGDYKPHGGFRFDLPGQTNDVMVTSPFTGTIYRGARYLVSGEVQYTFDIIMPCGFMTRLGHLRELTPKFQTIAEQLPPPVDGDSRTTNFTAGLTVTAGEAIATATGLRGSVNVFLDWGVYDLRQRNASSADPAWFAAHPGDVAPYAVCWFDYVSAANGAAVRALPSSDGVMGKTSDFCR